MRTNCTDDRIKIFALGEFLPISKTFPLHRGLKNMSLFLTPLFKGDLCVVTYSLHNIRTYPLLHRVHFM